MREEGIPQQHGTRDTLYVTRFWYALQVVRSLSACQGALLLVDATQGVQAQTLSTAKAAQAAGLKLVPVVTKIDLHHANVDVSV